MPGVLHGESRKRSLWDDPALEDQRHLSSYRHRELPGETRFPCQAVVKWRSPLGKSWEVMSASPAQHSDWLGLGQALCMMNSLCEFRWVSVLLFLEDTFPGAVHHLWLL